MDGSSQFNAADVVSMQRLAREKEKLTMRKAKEAPQSAAEVLNRLNARRDEQVIAKKKHLELHTEVVKSVKAELQQEQLQDMTMQASSSPFLRLSKDLGVAMPPTMLPSPRDRDSSQPLTPSPRPRTSLSGNMASRMSGLERVQLDLSSRASASASSSILSSRQASGLLPQPTPGASPRTSMSGRVSTSGTPAGPSPLQPKMTGLLSETVAGHHTSILGSIIGKSLAMEEEEFREWMSYEIHADSSKRGRSSYRTSLPGGGKVGLGVGTGVELESHDRASLSLSRSHRREADPQDIAQDIARMMRWKGEVAFKGTLKKEAEQALAKRRSLTEVQHPAVAAAAAAAAAAVAAAAAAVAAAAAAVAAVANREAQVASDSKVNEGTSGSGSGDVKGKNPRLSESSRGGKLEAVGYVVPDFGALINKRNPDLSDPRLSSNFKLTKGAFDSSDTDFMFKSKRGSKR